MRETTLRDVAELAGVSPRTVSNVVNGYAKVTDATRAKVERAIAELGYRPNVLARNLATGRSGQIVVVVPNVAAGSMKVTVQTDVGTVVSDDTFIAIALPQPPATPWRRTHSPPRNH